MSHEMTARISATEQANGASKRRLPVSEQLSTQPVLGICVRHKMRRTEHLAKAHAQEEEKLFSTSDGHERELSGPAGSGCHACSSCLDSHEAHVTRVCR